MIFARYHCLMIYITQYKFKNCTTKFTKFTSQNVHSKFTDILRVSDQRLFVAGGDEYVEEFAISDTT